MLFTILFQNLFLTLQFLTEIHFWGKWDVLKIRPLIEVFTVKRGFRGLTLAVLMEGTGRYLTACLMSLFINKTFISRFTSILSITSLFSPESTSATQTSKIKNLYMRATSQNTNNRKTPRYPQSIPKKHFASSPPISSTSTYIDFFPKTDSNLILRLVIFTSR